MLQYLVRFAKRVAVLLPGLAIGYVSIEKIYPALDKRIPAAIAWLVTYVLAAYVLIPFLFRLFRRFHKPRHLPVYSVTPDGYASDPVNIGVIGSRDEVVAAMSRAGWELADEHSLANVWKEVVCSLLHVPYPTAPMSHLHLLGRKQDLGFEIQIAAKWWHRHHVRFWATTFDKSMPIEPNSISWWLPLQTPDTGSNERFLWLGAASKDVGLALIKHNAQLTHMIHPDTDNERDLIVEQLEIEGATLEATMELVEPYQLVNRALSGYLQTDGKLKVVRLPESDKKPRRKKSVGQR